MEEEIAKVLNDNLGNRLSVELANGIYISIKNIIANAEKEKIKE